MRPAGRSLVVPGPARAQGLPAPHGRFPRFCCPRRLRHRFRLDIRRRHRRDVRLFPLRGRIRHCIRPQAFGILPRRCRGRHHHRLRLHLDVVLLSQQIIDFRIRTPAMPPAPRRASRLRRRWSSAANLRSRPEPDCCCWYCSSSMSPRNVAAGHAVRPGLRSGATGFAAFLLPPPPTVPVGPQSS